MWLYDFVDVASIIYCYSIPMRISFSEYYARKTNIIADRYVVPLKVNIYGFFKVTIIRTDFVRNVG